MTTRRCTTVAERHEFVDRHEAGKTYPEIADDMGWSQWTVRYWCRQARDKGRAALDPPDQRKERGGADEHLPRYRTRLLRLKLEHPGWGAEVAHVRVVDEHPALEIMTYPASPPLSACGPSTPIGCTNATASAGPVTGRRS